MPQDTDQTNALNAITEQRRLAVITLLFKPFEYGLIGIVIIGLLWSAQQLQVLPKTFKGFGVEIEIPEDQADVIQQSFDKIAALESDVSKLRNDLANLAKSAVIVNPAPEVSVEAIEQVAQDTLVTAPLTLEKKGSVCKLYARSTFLI